MGLFLRLLRTFFIIIFILYVFVYFSLNILITPYIIKKLPAYSSQYTTGIISVERIHFNIFLPIIDINNLTIKKNGQKSLIKINNITVTISPLALLRKKIIIRHSRINGGEFNLILNKEHKPVNILELLPKEKDKESKKINTEKNNNNFSFEINDILIEQIKFNFDMKIVKVKSFIRAVNLKGRELKGRVFAENTKVTVPKLKFNILKIRFDVLIKNNDIFINYGELTSKSPKAKIKFSANILNIPDVYFALYFDGNSTTDFLNKQIFKYPIIESNAKVNGVLRVGKNIPFIIAGIIKGDGFLQKKKFNSLYAKFKIYDTKLDIEKIGVKFGNGSINGRYSLTFKDVKSVSNMELTNFELESFPWTTVFANGKVNGTITTNGCYNPLELNFTGDVKAAPFFHFPERTINLDKGSLITSGTIRKDKLTVDKMLWTGKNNETVKARDFHIQYIDLKHKGYVEFDNVNIEKFKDFLGQNIVGIASGNANWLMKRELIEKISGNISINSLNSKWGTLSLIKGPFTLTKNLFVGNFLLKESDGKSFIQFHFNPYNLEEDINLRAEFYDFDIKQLSIPFIPQDFSSLYCTGKINLFGRINNHYGNSDIKLRGVYKGRKYSMKIDASGKNGIFFIENSKLDFLDGSIDFKGKIQESGNILLSGNGYFPAIEDNLVPVKLYNTHFLWKFKYSENKKYNLELSGKFEKTIYDNFFIKNYKFVVNLSDKLISIFFHNNVNKLTFSYNTVSDQWWGSLFYPNFNLTDISLIKDISISAKLDITAEGKYRDKSITKGKINIENISINKNSTYMKGSFDSNINNNFIVSNGNLKGNAGNIYLSGLTEIWKKNNVNLSGYLDVYTLGFVVPYISEGGGFIYFNFDLKDKWNQFNPVGEIKFVNTKILPANFNQEIIFNGTVSASKSFLSLNNIKISTGNGIGVLKGEIPLKKFKILGYNVYMDFHGVDFYGFDDIDISANGQLNLNGSYETPQLSGNIDILRGKITKDYNWEDNLLKKTYKIEELSSNKGIQLNIHISNSRDFTIVNNLADLNVKFDLWVMGTTEKFKLLGTIDLIKGNVIFRDNKFNLISGIINFDGLYPINPFLDMKFNSSVEDKSDNLMYDIFLTLQGKLKDVKLRLSSEPSLPEADILSLLIFKIKTSSLTTDKSEKTGGIEAGNLIFGQQIGSIENKIGELTSFDKISIEPSFSDISKQSNFKIKLIKRVSNNIDIAFSSSDYQELLVNTLISKNLRIGFGWDNKYSDFPGNFNISPHWYYEFNW